MELIEKQKQKALKLADFTSNKELSLFKNLLELQDMCDMTDKRVVDAMNVIVEQIKSINIPKPIDESERLDKILNKLNEDIEVELVIK